MWRDMLKIAAATAVFAAVHSTLASSAAKRTAEGLIGRRNRNGLYRVFFIAQSTVTSGLLVMYVLRRPGRVLYHVQGPPALVLHAGQIASLAATVLAARQVGLARISGVENVRAWLGDGPVPPEPAAQGPALDAEGLSHPAGPFAWSRHPLNFYPLLILLLHPRMTSGFLAFTAAATAYLVVGSWHEEVRLREAYGERYDEYRRRGVPFYLPSPSSRTWDDLICDTGAAERSRHVRVDRQAGAPTRV